MQAHGWRYDFLKQSFAQDLIYDGVLKNPKEQRFSLINRLTVAPHLPPNDAANSDEQYGERHVNPFVHGGIMSRTRQKSRTCAVDQGGRGRPSAGAFSTEAAGIWERRVRSRLSGGAGAGTRGLPGHTIRRRC